MLLFSDFEKISIKASASAQEATGAPVSFHPGFNAESPHEIMRIFMEAGGKSEKAIMSHLECKYYGITAWSKSPKDFYDQ